MPALLFETARGVLPYILMFLRAQNKQKLEKEQTTLTYLTDEFSKKNCYNDSTTPRPMSMATYVFHTHMYEQTF